MTIREFMRTDVGDMGLSSSMPSDIKPPILNADTKVCVCMLAAIGWHDDNSNIVGHKAGASRNKAGVSRHENNIGGLVLSGGPNVNKGARGAGSNSNIRYKLSYADIIKKLAPIIPSKYRADDCVVWMFFKLVGSMSTVVIENYLRRRRWSEYDIMDTVANILEDYSDIYSGKKDLVCGRQVAHF